MGKTKSSKETEGVSDGTHSGQTSAEGGTLEPALSDALQLHLDKVLEVINASREALEHKIEAVIININLLQAEQRKLADKVKSNETLLAEL